MSAIDAFLRDLRRRLPFVVRERVLAEVEDHLRESAREVGEEEALARFGSADALAESYRGRLRRLYAVLALLAAVAFPLVSYPIVENSLPPAPWPERDIPAELAWKRDWIAVLFVFAVLAGAVSLGGFLRDRRLVVWPAVVALGAIGVGGVFGTFLNWEWRTHVAGTPVGLVALGPLQVVAALAGLVLLLRAARLSRV